MALPQRIDDIQPIASPAEPLRIRRCTYRLVDRASRDPKSGYSVSCVYPDRRQAKPIGDLEESLEVCAGCTARHTFRADED
jgi:hypothetical protein